MFETRERWFDQCRFAKSLQRFEAIWNIKCKDYSNKDKRKAQLKELSAELDLPVDVCLLKYTTLRTYYVKQKRKVDDRNGNTSDDSEYIPSWPPFKYLGYLADTVELRRTRSSVETSKDLSAASGEHDKKSSANVSIIRSSMTSKRRKRKLSMADSSSESLTDETGGSFKCSGETVEPEDDVTYFTKLIGHQLRTIEDPLRRMRLQHQIQGMILDEITDMRQAPVVYMDNIKLNPSLSD